MVLRRFGTPAAAECHQLFGPGSNLVMVPARLRLLLSCAVFMLAVGCVDGSEPEVESTTTSSSVDASDGSDVVDAAAVSSRTLDCPFVVPEGTAPSCLQLTVPENWDTGSGEVKLIVAVFESPSAPADREPIVYLEGGPGSHALDTIDLRFAENWEPLLEHHDLVFFDQRGTGYSEPSLRCPGLTELARTAEDNPSLTPDEIQDRTETTLAQCRADFEARGIDIGQYNTINNARDAEAIRTELGYEQWNLLGISYGTRLGLELMRQAPDGIRAAVLDSVYPPQVDAIEEMAETFLQSLELVAAACDAEPDCASEGNLIERLVSAAADLEAQPREVEVVDFLTGSTDTVMANGDTLVSVVAGGLYAPFAFTDWPELLDDLENGGTSALSQYLSFERTNEAFLTSGMLYTFQCNEEVAFSDPSAVDAASPPDPFGLYDSAFGGGDIFAACAAIGAEQADPVSTEPVASDVPTLVLAGQFDPVTPPSWGQLAAETLTRSQFVLFAGESHSVSGGDCGTDLIVTFLADPALPLDTGCAAEGEVTFIDRPDDEIEVERVAADFWVGETSIVQPVDWANQNVGGIVNSRRGRSLLDSAELLQFSGPASIAGSLEGFITDALGVELGPQAASTVDRWTVRAGGDETVAVDFYERSSGDGEEGTVDLVLLIGDPDEIESLRTVLGEPVLEGFGAE